MENPCMREGMEDEEDSVGFPLYHSENPGDSALALSILHMRLCLRMSFLLPTSMICPGEVLGPSCTRTRVFS